MNNYKLWHRSLCAGFLLLQGVLPPSHVDAAERELRLEQAVELAQELDPWMLGSRFRQQALEAQSHAAGSLPDPTVNAGFANLPTDTFDFNQEQMTQFRVGVTQALPRGNSRTLRQEQLTLLGTEQAYQRADRRARVAAEVSNMWLDAWRAQETIRLIEAEREIFEGLIDSAQSNYVNAVGGTRQLDLVQAQLELTRLEDRVVMLQQDLDVARSRMDPWLSGGEVLSAGHMQYELPRELPEITTRSLSPVTPNQTPSQQEIAELLRWHPALQTIERRLEASSTGIELAEQSYRPEWRINASYGYRDDDPFGAQRADFFSFGVSMDLPLFPSNRQDQQVISASAKAESVRTERALLLRELVADLSAEHVRLQRLSQRQALYRLRLLSDTGAQYASALEAYANNDGDFSEVVSAKIAQLNASIEALAIAADRQKTIARINYFLASSDGVEGQTKGTDE